MRIETKVKIVNHLKRGCTRVKTGLSPLSHGQAVSSRRDGCPGGGGWTRTGTSGLSGRLQDGEAGRMYRGGSGCPGTGRVGFSGDDADRIYRRGGGSLGTAGPGRCLSGDEAGRMYRGGGLSDEEADSIYRRGDGFTRTVGLSG